MLISIGIRVRFDLLLTVIWGLFAELVATVIHHFAGVIASLNLDRTGTRMTAESALFLHCSLQCVHSIEFAWSIV